MRISNDVHCKSLGGYLVALFRTPIGRPATEGAVDRKAMISGRPKQPTGFHRFPADSGGLRHLKSPRNTECWGACSKTAWNRLVR